MAARRFLYIVAALILLTLAAATSYRIWGQKLLAVVMIPKAHFTVQPPLSPADYAKRSMWLARPDMGAADPALWLPPSVVRTEPGSAAIFYVHPTSYLAPFTSAHWNDTLTDKDSDTIAQRLTKGQASAFNTVGQIWAPRYRQAHFGAFLTESDDATRAINAAYHDVAAAFDAFLAANPSGPIILVGHSQGSLHLMRLMKEKIAGKPAAARIAAAYLAGWPVSITADIPAMGLPACQTAQQAGCILSWQSFAEPAETSPVTQAYARYRGLTGADRTGTPMLCTNPLTGRSDSAAPASANLGTLVQADPAGNKQSELVKGAVGARCGNGKNAGYLLIGEPPELGPYVLPGNNYHVYDYALFWANIRADAQKRLATYLKQHS